MAIQFDPLPYPRDPDVVVTYRVTVRTTDPAIPVLTRHEFPTLCQARQFVEQEFPQWGPVPYEVAQLYRLYGAIHQHEVGPGHGRIVPVSFHAYPAF